MPDPADANPLRTVEPSPAFAPDANDAEVLDVLVRLLVADSLGGALWPDRAAIMVAFRARVAGAMADEILDRYARPLAVKLLPVGLTATDLHTTTFAAVDQWEPREHAAAYVDEYVIAWLDREFDMDAPAGGAPAGSAPAGA